MTSSLGCGLFTGLMVVRLGSAHSPELTAHPNKQMELIKHWMGPTTEAQDTLQLHEHEPAQCSGQQSASLCAHVRASPMPTPALSCSDRL